MKIKLCKKFIYRVQEGDNLKNICSKFNCSKEGVLRNNYNIDFYVGELVEITVNDYATHIVKPAQTIQEIASMYNMDIEELKKDNNLLNEKLFIGQCLKIYFNNKEKRPCN